MCLCTLGLWLWYTPRKMTPCATKQNYPNKSTAIELYMIAVSIEEGSYKSYLGQKHISKSVLKLACNVTNLLRIFRK